MRSFIPNNVWIDFYPDEFVFIPHVFVIGPYDNIQSALYYGHSWGFTIEFLWFEFGMTFRPKT